MKSISLTLKIIHWPNYIIIEKSYIIYVINGVIYDDTIVVMSNMQHRSFMDIFHNSFLSLISFNYIKAFAVFQ